MVVQRSSVSLPACPNWSQPPNEGFDNQPMSNWSCATAVNFGLMLADPNDLVRGRDPGNADGEALARSIESYRKGRTKDIIRDSRQQRDFPGGGARRTPANRLDDARHHGNQAIPAQREVLVRGFVAEDAIAAVAKAAEQIGATAPRVVRGAVATASVSSPTCPRRSS